MEWFRHRCLRNRHEGRHQQRADDLRIYDWNGAVSGWLFQGESAGSANCATGSTVREWRNMWKRRAIGRRRNRSRFWFVFLNDHVVPTICFEECEKAKRLRSDIKKEFLEDILLGMGVSEEFARRQCAAGDRTAISIDDKLKELRSKLMNHSNTFEQYVTLQNLFLVISQPSNYWNLIMSFSNF